jgi:hypothetical protein
VVEAAALASSASVDERTYSVQDVNVTPPELRFPRTIKSWPAGSRQDVPYLEVVVNEKGTVDGVKARQTPATIAESVELLTALSSVHNWRFRPAERSGHSVKYRLVLVRGLF